MDLLRLHNRCHWIAAHMGELGRPSATVIARLQHMSGGTECNCKTRDRSADKNPRITIAWSREFSKSRAPWSSDHWLKNLAEQMIAEKRVVRFCIILNKRPSYCLLNRSFIWAETPSYAQTEWRSFSESNQKSHQSIPNALNSNI